MFLFKLVDFAGTKLTFGVKIDNLIVRLLLIGCTFFGRDGDLAGT